MKKSGILCALVLALQPGAVLAHPRPGKAQSSASNCAYEAQTSVAKRHRLTVRDAGSLSMTIYAKPELAKEADDLFDACVRRHSMAR